MIRGRSPLKIRPEPETNKEKSAESPITRKDQSQRRSPARVKPQSESPVGRIILNNDRRSSLSNVEKRGAPVLSRTKLEKNRVPDLLRTNSEKSRASVLSRTSSEKNRVQVLSKEEDDSNTIKKQNAHNFMKTTRSFNAKSLKPVELKDEKIRKKPESDQKGMKQKTEGFCAKTCRNPYCSLNHNKPTTQTFSYLKSRSRSPSIDSQNSPRYLRRMNSIEKRNFNLSGSFKKNRQDNKVREKEEIEVEKNVLETYCNEEIKRVEEPNFENLFEGNGILEIEENEIIMMDEVKILEDNSEKHEVINENISENNADEVWSPLEAVTENEILENDSVVDENVPETNEIENSFSLETILEDENSEKYEVIDTKNEEISDLYDGIDSPLQEMSIEDELSKFTGTNDSNIDEFESIGTKLTKEKSEKIDEIESIITKLNQESSEKIEHLIGTIDSKFDELESTGTKLNQDNSKNIEQLIGAIDSKFDELIGTKLNPENLENNEQHNKVASFSPIIEDIIANELEEMEEDSTGEDEETEPKRRPKKWLVDYALQRLIRKLETSEKLNDINKVSMLIGAYESVVPLALRRKFAPH